MIDQTTLIIIVLAIVVLIVVASRLLSRRDRELPEAEAEAPVPDEMSPVAPADLVAGEEPVAAAPINELLEDHAVEELARTPTPQPLGPPDDLTRLKGLGPKAAGMLNALGITRYDQLAILGDDDLDRIDRQMGTFQGRLARDRWVEQARFLADGDKAGFEERFGKLG